MKSSIITQNFIYKIMDNQFTQPINHVQRQREKKHKQIITAINNYKRSPEEMKNLDKIKQATRMEIEMRFNNSHHNRAYQFPTTYNSSDQDSQQEFSITGQIIYDLHSQTQMPRKTLSTKTLHLDAGRRVKSLERQQIPEEDQIINKMKRKPLQLFVGKNPDTSHILTRKNSLRQRRDRNKSNLKLPQLKKTPTQKKNGLEQIVGKKIYTQSSSPDKKGLVKYLKKMETTSHEVLKQEPKKFFLQQC